MENVNKYDNCKEQQNEKNDANDKPCGGAFGHNVLDDSYLNVCGHFGPANNGCALGKRCVHCFGFAVVCNAVYDPSDSILSSGKKQFNFCQECSFIKGSGITVGQLKTAVCGAFNLVKNHICRSTCQSGKVGCVENGTCRNGNCEIIIGNNNLGVFNDNDNVGCGHCELVAVYCNCIATSCAVNGFKHLNNSGVTGLRGNGNGDFGACESAGVIGRRVAIGEYIVGLVVSNTIEVDGAVACHQHAKSQFGKLYITIDSGVSPNVTGDSGINLILQVCKLTISPIGNRECTGGVFEFATNVEVYSNLSLSIVYTEQGNILTQNDGFLTEPVPTILGLIALRVITNNGLNKCSGIGNIIGNDVFESVVQHAVYIVVNIVGSCLSVVCKGNSLSGHCERISCKQLTVNLCSNILIAGKGLFCDGNCNGFACLIPTIYAADCCDRSVSNQVAICIVSVGVNIDTILIHDGVSGEVRCKEFNGLVVCNNAQNLLAICINESLFVVTGLACERKNKVNAFTEVSDCIYAAKRKLIGFFAAGCAGAVKLVRESNNITGCRTNKSVEHGVGEGYLLCTCCSKNEATLNFAQEFFGKFEFYAVFKGVPVICNGNDGIVVFGCDNDSTLIVLDCNIGSDLAGFIRIGLFGSSLLRFCGSGLFRSGILGFCGSGLLRSGISGFCGSGLLGSGLAGFCGSGLLRSGYFGNDLLGSGSFGFNIALNGSLYNDVLCGHLVNEVTGLGVNPTLSALILGVIEHLGKVGAYGQQSFENNNTVVILEGYGIEVGYLNGNIKSGGHFCLAAIQDHIHGKAEHLLDLIFVDRYASIYKIENLAKFFFYNFSCIKGNALCKYKGGVACIEIHQAVVGNNIANLGCQQTVNNANCIALYKIVNAACVFCLVNNCGIEVCKRIGGSCCLLKQILHIEVIACNITEFINNVVNSVIKVSVNLCGQTVCNLDAGNVFEFFYKYFESRNGCESINEILCFEVVGEIITGNSFNIGKENLCIVRCKCLVVYLAEESRVNRFENSNDFFKSQILCECNKVIGLCCVSGKNLILECVHFGIAGISHSLKSHAEYACKFGGNLNICYQLAIGQTNIANLIKQVRNLCGSTANHIGACGENKVKVDFLGLFNLTVKVRDCKGCGKQLAAIIEVCKFIESGNKIFESIDQSCRQQFEVTVFVLCSNNNTIEFNLGDGFLHSCNNAEYIHHVGFEIELAQKLLGNIYALCINNLDELLNVNLVNKSANVDSLDQTFSIDNIGDNAIAKDALNDSLNVKGINKTLEVGNIVNQGLVAAGNSGNSIANTDFLNCCCVVNQACNDLIGSNITVLKLCLQLCLQNSSIGDNTTDCHIKQFVIGEEIENLLVYYKINQSLSIQTHYEVGQLCSVSFNQLLGIDVRYSRFDIVLVNVAHEYVDILDVGLQIHILEQADKTIGIYASEQLIGINASKKRFCIDIGNDRLSKIDNLIFGKDSQKLLLGHKIAKTAACRHSLKEALNVTVLDVRQEGMRINGNGNVGRRYVAGLSLVSVHVQPIVSQNTDGQNCQNSDDS